MKIRHQYSNSSIVRKEGTKEKRWIGTSPVHPGVHAKIGDQVFVFWILYRQRISASSGPDGVRIVIPYWNSGAIGFLVLWTMVNANFGYLAWRGISHGCVGSQSWTRFHLSELGCVAGVGIVLWIVFGREVVTITQDLLCIRYQVFGLGWSKRFAQSDVQSLGASFFLDHRARGKWDPALVHTELYFSYAGKIRTFGKDISTRDARRLVEVIHQSFPRIVGRSGE